ncbi:hypothetical protein [Photobacterium leiognathi]|uniref:hypothetical protein n=1 Tax=Photobacterium leiognathi TaxID=553611 RepID=UPI002981C53B|nr:hypothetical protein [Photobacterium leiognathi]
MSIQSKIDNIIEIAEAFHNFDVQFLFAALKKCQSIFAREFTLKNGLFNVDGVFNYVLTHVPTHYLSDHLKMLSDKEVEQVECNFESLLNNFYDKHNYLRAI